jgi:hypothetical protein
MTRAENRKYHIIYKTTNLVNGKFYIGMHSTDDLNDGYMGSGKRLRYSLDKYGKENHQFEILEFCQTRKDVILREEEIVNEQFLGDPLCLNLVCGGKGGFQGADGWLGKNNSEAFSEKYQNDEKFKASMKAKWTAHKVKLRDEGFKFFDGTSYDWTGKNHSDDTKKKMRNSHLGKHTKEKNSQFGTCWICNEELQENKKIKNEELQQWIDYGWIKGRNKFRILPVTEC